MKVIISLLLAVLAAIVATVFSAVGRAGGEDTAAYSGHLQAKIEYCEDCHGSSGRGYVGFLIMPRLAGQTTPYLESQLRAFVERTRDRDLFINMAMTHGLSPEMRTAVAIHFQGANPGPFGGAPRHQMAAGKKIYEEGVPEANVPACMACHGPEAKGQEANPRLAGQLYPYIKARLMNWHNGRSQEPAIMVRIARSMTGSQIAAVAAYLSGLK
jgi:cytochrome c553